MFCPKCGKDNPEDAHFCRKCGNDLSGLSVEESNDFGLEQMVSEGMGTDLFGSHKGSKKGRKKHDTWEGAMGTLFTGVAFAVIASVLAFQPMGQGWWFWMFIPAFAMIGSGVAQILRITYGERSAAQVKIKEEVSPALDSATPGVLPPKQTEYATDQAPQRYKTGELVPPSVVEGTTRHLELDSEGKTTKLTQEDN